MPGHSPNLGLAAPLQRPEPADCATPARSARQRETGFDLVRLLAAGMVIYGHSFSLASERPPGVLGNSIATIGVKIFFVISGYLITRSWLSDPDPIRYAWRRGLRIMPGLACLTLVTVALLGPLFSSLGPAQYFAQPKTWQYFWNVAFYPIYSLPGVFASNPYPTAVNGSLWSLPSEVLMYVVTPLLIGRLAQRGVLGLVMTAIVIAGCGLYYVRLAPPAASPVFYGTSIVSLLDVAPYFQLGAVYAAFNLQRFSRPWFSILLLVSAAVGIGAMASRVDSYVWSECVLMLLLPYCVVSIGSQRIAVIEKPLAMGDISYGLYLYGFPIQQAVMALSGGSLGALALFAIALPCTAVCAALSWHLVERPALSFKPKARSM